MGRSIQGGAGGILELLDCLAEFEEFIRCDLLSVGRSLDELGHSLSWWDLKCFLRHHHAGAYAREYARRIAEQERREANAAKPVEEQQFGSVADALPIDELNAFLGWD